MQCDVEWVNFSHGPLWLKPQHLDGSQEGSFKMRTCDFAASLGLVWTRPNGQSGPGAELHALAEANKWLDKQIIVPAFWCGGATSARELKIPYIQYNSTTSHVSYQEWCAGRLLSIFSPIDWCAVVGRLALMPRQLCFCRRFRQGKGIQEHRSQAGWTKRRRSNSRRP